MQRLLALSAAWLCVATFAPTQAASAQAPQAGQKAHEWPYRLPLWGNRLAERGIAFPLPCGVALNYAWVDQPITIDGLELAINDGEYVNLDDVVKFERVDASVHALNARFDMWLLPMLNLYGLLNYAARADTDVLLSEPFPLEAGATQQGGGGGMGGTLAMGFWGFFGTFDFNWTRNRMQKLDAPVNTFLITPRVGRRVFRIGKVELTAWLGAMYQRIGVNTSGKILLSDAVGETSDEARAKVEDWYDGLSPGRKAAARALVEELRETVGTDPMIRYRLNKHVAYPWNMIVGAQLEVTPRWQARVEVGFIHRTQVIVGLSYRFGILKPRPSGPTAPS